MGERKRRKSGIKRGGRGVFKLKWGTRVEIKPLGRRGKGVSKCQRGRGERKGLKKRDEGF